MSKLSTFKNVTLLRNSLKRKLCNPYYMKKFQTSTMKAELYDGKRLTAHIIGSIHKSLRTSLEGKDIQEVKTLWLEHTQNKRILNQYCEAVKLQANNWEEKSLGSRVKWTYSSIKEYFFGGLLLRKIEEEERRISALELNNKEELLKKAKIAKESIGLNKKLKVLDVGSCYNPFAMFEDLDVTAIDLYPAKPDVYCCDFLDLKVVEGSEDMTSLSKTNESFENLSAVDISSRDQRCKTIKIGLEDKGSMEDICHNSNSVSDKSREDLDALSEIISHDNIYGKLSYENKFSNSFIEEAINKEKESARKFMPDISPEQFLHINELNEASFDVVIFAYVLDYIPSPKLRYECCVKAYKLLKSNGLLCISMPMSRRKKINAFLFSLWKSSLALKGFERIKYREHQFSQFHGMIFRKVLDPSTLKEKTNQELEMQKQKFLRRKYIHSNWETVYDSLYITPDFQLDDEE